MVKKLRWTSVLIFLFLCSCSNDAGKPETEPGELTTEQPAEMSESSQLQNTFPQFFSFLSGQDPSFSIDKFVQNESGPIDTVQAYPVDNEKLQSFSAYLVYNSDSTQAIDLYSYNYISVQRDGKTTLERGEPDTEIGLIDTRSNTRRRIFFSGPGTTVQQAKWQDANTILLAGVEEVSQEALKPVMWKIMLPQKTIQVYNYTDTLHASVANFNPSSNLETRQ